MARTRKCDCGTRDDMHALHIREDTSEAILVRGGKRAYLWVGPERRIVSPDSVHAFSGPKALRALAHAILDEVGDDNG